MNNSIASESGHWYTRSGQPMYTIIGRNGKERPTTLKDARELDLVPSVTTITDIMKNYGLEQFKVRQAALSALTIPKIEGESDEDFINRIITDSKQQGKEAADLGTRIHAAIELMIQGKEYNKSLEAYVKSGIECLENHLGTKITLDNCEAEKSFAHPLGFGGKVDLHSREIYFVADFKSKAFGTEDKIKPWPNQPIQLAAYRLGLQMPLARLINVFISSTHPGHAVVVEYDKEDTSYINKFLAIHNLWQVWNGVK